MTQISLALDRNNKHITVTLVSSTKCQNAQEFRHQHFYVTKA